MHARARRRRASRAMRARRGEAGGDDARRAKCVAVRESSAGSRRRRRVLRRRRSHFESAISRAQVTILVAHSVYMRIIRARGSNDETVWCYKTIASSSVVVVVDEVKSRVKGLLFVRRGFGGFGFRGGFGGGEIFFDLGQVAAVRTARFAGERRQPARGLSLIARLRTNARGLASL